MDTGNDRKSDVRPVKRNIKNTGRSSVESVVGGSIDGGIKERHICVVGYKKKEHPHVGKPTGKIKGLTTTASTNDEGGKRRIF